MATENWARRYIGEALGTYLLILFGCSAVAVAVLYGQLADLVTAGLAWGFSVALAVWVAGSLSGAHINPAVTLGMAAIGRHPWRKVPHFWASQVTGAFLGAATVLLVFGGAIAQWAADQGIVVGRAGGERVGMILAPYSPHPLMVGIDADAYAAVPVWRGFLTELIGTAILIIVVLVLLEARSVNAPASWAFPMVVAVLITMLTVVTAAHTMTSLNPARDLGPRLMLLLSGYGVTAFPGPRAGMSLLVTAGAPLVGGLFGAVVFDRLLKPLYWSADREALAGEAASRLEKAVSGEQQPQAPAVAGDVSP